MNGEGPDWQIYTGTGEPHDGIDRLPPPPPWRAFDGEPALGLPDAVDRRLGDRVRGSTYRAVPEVVEAVNTALYLRRPLLVTGPPGAGKLTLAYSVAAELGLGSVLYWSINSRSTVADGLYAYDAIGRLQDLNLRGSGSPDGDLPDIGSYLRLGPLGTAFLPWERPRVVLIDELDKSDIDLPNDLLTLLEEGSFVIPELARLAGQPEVAVHTADAYERVGIRYGTVSCRAFPFVIITSNGERQFPAPFLRRCVRVDLAQPDSDQLAAIVRAHLGDDVFSQSLNLIKQFLDRREAGELATDQLLNAVFLATSGQRPPADAWLDLVLRPLSGSP